MKLFFDPLDSRCKSPTGAVREGTEVRFNVFADECEAELLLRLRSRFSDKQSTVALERRGTGFSAAYTFDAPDVLYYRFETPDGKVFADDGTLRAVAEGTDWFIQTVYSRDYAVPESFAGRVMYQIFPDSFAKSGDAKAGVPSDRQYLSTGDTPRWRPDKSGRYSNSYYGGDLADFSHNVAGAAFGDGAFLPATAERPFAFVDREGGNYRAARAGCVTVNAGVRTVPGDAYGVLTGLDLDGNRRAVTRPDVGCYESCFVNGLLIHLR